MFIVFEGGNAVGKATQAKLLSEYYKTKGVECVLTEEPTFDTVGSFIKQILGTRKDFDPSAMQLLFVADRADHLSSTILPALQASKTVISDRYYLSTISFGMATGVDKTWLEALNSQFPRADITFILDVDTDTVVERLSKRNQEQNRPIDMHESKRQILEDTRKAYLELAKETPNCFVIDGKRSIEQIHSEIIKIIESK